MSKLASRSGCLVGCIAGRAGEDRGAGVDERVLDGRHWGCLPQQALQRGGGGVLEAAGDDGVVPAQVGGDVEREAVLGDALADTYADRRQLRRGALAVSRADPD